MIHFLSGLPRSGSTLLAAVLNQHPAIHVSATSPLIDVMGAVAQAWEGNPAVAAQGRAPDDAVPLLAAMAQTHYQGVTKPIILDKSRGWPAPPIVRTMGKVLGAPPKIVATVRSVPDCAASFVRVAKPETVKAFLRNSALIQHLKSSYVTLQQGYEAHPECFLFVDYDDLMQDPKQELDRVLEFLQAEPFYFDLDAIEGSTVAERDEAAWGVPGLHDIKPKLQRQHNQKSKTVLGSMFASFCQPAFWRGEKERAPQLLDMQKDANTHGDFAKGWEIAQELEKTEPDNDRAAFNRAWHVLAQGRLQAGMALLDRGREEETFGNPSPSGQPLWDGGKIRGKTLLINLEGGLGDQIHAARWAKLLGGPKGAKVILAGSPQLAPLLLQVPGVSAFVESRAAGGVYHDCWYPGMSLVRVLGGEYPLEWNDLDGSPYLPCPPAKQKTGRLRVGIRWAGNPRYEEDLHRSIPAERLFALKGVDLVSLQKDSEIDIPSHVEQPDLGDWLKTKAVIDGLDLVISSCTSVAHLAAAMGKPTWCVIPILPYYLWALQGDKTPWYDSMTLYRQEKFGDWDAPLKRIEAQLLNTTIGGCCDAVCI